MDEHLAEFDANIEAPTNRFTLAAEPIYEPEYEDATMYNEIEPLDLEEEKDDNEYLEPEVPQEEYGFSDEESLGEDAEDWEVNARDWGVNERTPTPPPVVQNCGGAGISVVSSNRSKDVIKRKDSEKPKKKVGVAKIKRKTAAF